MTAGNSQSSKVINRISWDINLGISTDVDDCRKWQVSQKLISYMTVKTSTTGHGITYAAILPTLPLEALYCYALVSFNVSTYITPIIITLLLLEHVRIMVVVLLRSSPICDQAAPQ